MLESIKKPWNKNSMALDLVLSQVKDINTKSLIQLFASFCFGLSLHFIISCNNKFNTPV
jgi:hypothetical protein